MVPNGPQGPRGRNVSHPLVRKYPATARYLTLTKGYGFEEALKKLKKHQEKQRNQPLSTAQRKELMKKFTATQKVLEEEDNGENMEEETEDGDPSQRGVEDSLVQRAKSRAKVSLVELPEPLLNPFCERLLPSKKEPLTRTPEQLMKHQPTF